MPKGSKKKRGRRSGAHAPIAESSGEGAEAMDLEALTLALEASTVNEDDVSLKPEEDVVEVIYGEPPLKRVQWVPFGASITRDWLRRCAVESHQEWKDQLPSSVQPSDLVGRLVPEDAKTFADISVGKGVVILELEDSRVNAGLVGHLATSKAGALTLEERISSLEERLQENDAKLEMKLAAQHVLVTSTFQQEVLDLKRSVEAQNLTLQAQNQTIEEQNHTIEEQNHTISSLGVHLEKLQVFLRKGLDLSNKVKMRVTLTLARAAVEKAVGRMKEDAETWSSFIAGLSPAEWSVVGISKKLVKELLAGGAYQLNDSIHNIPAEEVVGAIAGMRQGSLRGAWEEVFFIAFQKHVSDEVFAEEVDYAIHQQEMLGLTGV